MRTAWHVGDVWILIPQSGVKPKIVHGLIF